MLDLNARAQEATHQWTCKTEKLAGRENMLPGYKEIKAKNERENMASRALLLSFNRR
jgi:hypothetical protein